jgi:hypothetical protein
MSLVAAPLAGSSSRADFARSNTDRQTAVATVACVGACALVLVSPFEASAPLLTLPGQSLSTVEAALVAVLGGWTAALLVARAFPVWRAPLALPWLGVLATMLAAALAAPGFHANAIHMVGRMALAGAVYLMVVNGVVTVAQFRATVTATVAAGTAVAVLAILEYLGADPVLRLLSNFRPWVAVAASQVRASGPLQYPTIASMFLEVAFAFAIGLMLTAIDTRRRAVTVTVAIVAVVIAQGIVVTFTRAGLLTIASTLGLVGALRYRRAGFDRGGAALAIVAAACAAQLMMSRSTEYLRLRLTTETMEAWFRADVDAPVNLQLTTGSRATVPVRLRNTGGATWDSSAPQPFQLAYHWLRADQDRVVIWEGLRTPFPVPVFPGSTIVLDAQVEAPPQPGEYRLMWDIEQRHRLWFSTEPDAARYTTRVVVSGPPAGSPTVVAGPDGLPAIAVRPGRFVLWRAAGRLLASHPLFGVGPDNFRLSYGEAAGLSNFDRRLHANNMYIEMLVGGGLIGGAAFMWLCWAAAKQAATAAAVSFGMTLEGMVGAIAAATLAIGLHGLVDSFLSFTATYILIAVTLGLMSASLALIRTHAHRF